MIANRNAIDIDIVCLSLVVSPLVVDWEPRRTGPEGCLHRAHRVRHGQTKLRMTHLPDLGLENLQLSQVMVLKMQRVDRQVDQLIPGTQPGLRANTRQIKTPERGAAHVFASTSPATVIQKLL